MPTVTFCDGSNSGRGLGSRGQRGTDGGSRESGSARRRLCRVWKIIHERGAQKRTTWGNAASIGPRGRSRVARRRGPAATHLLQFLHELEHRLVGLLLERREVGERGRGGSGSSTRARGGGRSRPTRQSRRGVVSWTRENAPSRRPRRTLRGTVSVPSTSNRARVFPVFWRFAMVRFSRGRAAGVTSTHGCAFSSPPEKPDDAPPALPRVLIRVHSAGYAESLSRMVKRD